MCEALLCGWRERLLVPGICQHSLASRSEKQLARLTAFGQHRLAGLSKARANAHASHATKPSKFRKTMNKYMKNSKFLLLFIFLLISEAVVFGQSKISNRFQADLERINKKVAQAFTEKNIDLLIRHFEKNAVCMPEFQPTLKGTDAIREYYTEIMSSRETKSFNKVILETIELKNNIAEIGTFSTTYQRVEGKEITLNGKYLMIWAIQPNGALKIKAESFGYLHNIDNPALHVVKITREQSAYKLSERTQAEENLAFQLSALNTLMEKSVQQRDGNVRADFFTDDAIFMPFADSSKIGMNSIRKHLIAYNSYPVKIDTISIYNEYIEDCGNYVIEYPRFYVKWHTADNSGVGSGKGIRIWRRENNYYLKLYREIGIHDHID
jgi:ketosteroid isomerase-like protein